MDLDRPRRIHLVGVGGAGMSALAKVLAGMGHRVSGSDLRHSEALARLLDAGLEVWAGHRPESITGVDLVVASSAVPDSDPEVVAARTAGVEVWRRPRLLGEITSRIPTVGPTGTHGKTSSAAMTVAALRAAGADPWFVIGGDAVDLGTNGAVGSDRLMVLEVDEAFRTFEAVTLRGLQVTNVDQDHLEHFDSPEDLREAFVRVASGVRGPVVACIDDPGAAELARRVGAITYGTEPADWRIVEPGPDHFGLVGRGRRWEVRLGRPGIHMARNAAGVVALLAELGYDPDALVAGLEGFRGVRRRFELRGTVGGVRIYDDYAHHPAEVEATIAAARSVEGGRLWAVFQPHLFSRTARFAGELGRALAAADVVVVTDVYGAREDPIPGVTGRLVVEAAKRAGARDVRYVPHRGEVARSMVDDLRPGDVVLTMGAGDITVVPTELARLLEDRG
jgi:UDP-N-acetylmuramate--alanine ligase